MNLFVYIWFQLVPSPHNLDRFFTTFIPPGLYIQQGCTGRRSFLHIWDASARFATGHCWYLVHITKVLWAAGLILLVVQIVNKPVTN